MTNILFIDPGKVSGWFILVTDWSGSQSNQLYPMLCVGGEMAHEPFLDYWGAPSNLGYRRGGLESDVSTYGASKLQEHRISRVVMEKFDITPTTYQTVKGSDPLWAVEQIGQFRTWSRWNRIPFELQSRTAKNFDRDGSKLKKMGWWKPAEGVTGEAGHRRDAARHALKWGVDHGLIKPEVLL